MSLAESIQFAITAAVVTALLMSTGGLEIKAAGLSVNGRALPSEAVGPFLKVLTVAAVFTAIAAPPLAYRLARPLVAVLLGRP